MLSKVDLVLNVKGVLGVDEVCGRVIWIIGAATAAVVNTVRTTKLEMVDAGRLTGEISRLNIQIKSLQVA